MDTFKGAAKNIEDIDISRIASTIGVGEDEIHAFMDVEAAGSPWDGHKRPKMLFEPHRFYALLGKGAKRDRAVKEGLAYAKWGSKPYPKDSYPRLLKAMQIDADKALMAASWGLTQIMGEWFKDLGYAMPGDMVRAFMDDAESHLEATVKLLTKWKIDDDLRAHRWATVARVWNGPGYKKNSYDVKMRKAFAKWQKIKNTPFSPNEKPLLSPEPPVKPAPTEPVVIIDTRTEDVTVKPAEPVENKKTGLITALAFIGVAVAAFWEKVTNWVWSLF